jgi:hypothetical protein
MPFVGDVFGLNAAYDRQVLNVEQRNVLNWPEYPTYGYFVGGTSVNSPSQSSTITRLDLATNVGSLPGKNLPAARIAIASVSNNFYGYFGGGYLNTLVRLDFSNETSSIPGKNFTQNSRSSQAAVSNLLYGYFGGGYAPGFASIISRLEFSSETVSNPNINLSPSRARFAAVSSSTYGYFGGGYTPTLRSTITRLDFTNETLVDPGKNLPTGIGDHSALSNISYGYFGGGTGVCTINRLDFSNETVSAPGKNLPSVRRGPLVFSSSTATGSLNGSYGYFGGGGTPGGSGIIHTIQRIDYQTENIDTLSATLGQQVRSGAAVANSGSSFRTNSKTYGYFIGGGSTPSGSCTITRLDFSSETVNLPGKNLLERNSSFSSVANNYYGYNAGGYGFPPVPFSYKNTISRLDFSNETINLPGKNLPLGRSNIASVTSSSYGYFGGGYIVLPPGIYFCTIIRLDFSNETVSDPGKNFPSGRSSIASVTSSSYGYFVNGFNTDPGFGNDIDTISRLDFSSETISIPSNSFPSIQNNSKTVSNSSFGYFGGGNGGLASNVISRLDFSNETVSDPGKNLPSARFYGAATSSSFYGYFAGGNIVFPATTYNTIMRLDFSTENASLSANNLPAARTRISAVSNSN